jgi:uncharacterized membrane protein YedE/YeeE
MQIMTLSILFAVSAIGGFVMHRSDFCIAGMFRDFFLFKRTSSLKALFVLVLVSMVFFHLFHAAGPVPAIPFPWYATPTMGALIGGIIFGIGMVLAGGCIIGTLYKVGAGQGISIAALAGTIAGSGLFIFTAGTWAPAGKFLKINTGDVTILQTLGIDWAAAVPVAAAAGGILVWRWHRNGSFTLSHTPESYIHPVLTAVILSSVSLVSMIIISIPPGITTSYTKLFSGLIYFFSPEQYADMPIFKKRVVDYYNPFTDTSITGTIGYKIDGIFFVQLPVITGVISGSFISALRLGEFSLRFNAPFKQYISGFTGGVLMGWSARISAGCNVWHIFGGMPVFGWTAIIFIPSIMAGAWIGSILLKSVVLRN